MLESHTARGVSHAFGLLGPLPRFPRTKTNATVTHLSYELATDSKNLRGSFYFVVRLDLVRPTPFTRHDTRNFYSAMRESTFPWQPARNRSEKLHSARIANRCT